MDELLRDFLTETGESLDVVDVELVRFEQEPNNGKILENIFRLVHTIKGTCGFLGLPRLEVLTHAAESLLENFHDGKPVTREAVSLVLASIDRIKMLLNELERNQKEPEGDDLDLITDLRVAAVTAGGAPAARRPARPKQISLAEIERALRNAHGNEEDEEPERAPTVAAAPSQPPRRDAPAADVSEPAGRDRPDGKVAGHSIRVHLETLDQLMTMVSELVLTRNQLIELVRRHEDSEFKGPLQRLSNVTASLQEGVLKTRMQPIGNAWQKLPRIVRDLSSELGKPIELEMYGADTELDRQVLDLIKDPLIHMVRNSADHGLESRAERQAAGKHERGTIRLSARHQGGHIIIEISDDGRGLDIERIRAKAIALGSAPEVEIEKMTDAQVQKFIFTSGFSTASKVTSVSGRGIGMDVVRANIEEIGGTIEVKSVPGRGTTFTIKIPLTLAIAAALIVESAGDRFAIPQLAVLELVSARANKEHRIERIKGAAVLRLRNKLLPLVDLKSMLGIAGPADKEVGNSFIVVTQVGSKTFGIVVDRVFHTEEIVLKPMSSKLRHIPTFSGTTILGDGSVILIVDPGGVAQAIGGAHAARQEEQEHEQGSKSGSEAAATESMLVFRAGSPNQKAVPISLVTRLEEIDVGTIEMANGRPLVQYRGQLMPLVLFNDDVRIKTGGSQPLLVFSDDERSMGLVVDEIVDIVEDRLDIELGSEQPGLLGSAVIKGQATEVIDVTHFLPLAFEGWHDRRRHGAGKTARNVLLVDDVPFFRNMLAPLLKAAGYAVTSVASARDALALLEGGARFDVVVTDIEMPGMDGFELASVLRGDPRTAELPIIGLASLVSAEAAARGKAVGLHDYVAKFDRQGLIAALQERTAATVRAA
jgi:two-component system chemotaxis sensor kinase CheA